jgi:hypothetical protein
MSRSAGWKQRMQRRPRIAKRGSDGMGAPFFRHFSRLKLFEIFLGGESCGMSSTMYCLLLEVVIELLVPMLQNKQAN